MDHQPTPDYARLYKEARKLAGITQRQLAREIGVTPVTIKRTESGERTPGRAEIIAVAVICQLPLDFFGMSEDARRLESLARIQRELRAAQAGLA